MKEDVIGKNKKNNLAPKRKKKKEMVIGGILVSSRPEMRHDRCELQGQMSTPLTLIQMPLLVCYCPLRLA